MATEDDTGLLSGIFGNSAGGLGGLGGFKLDPSTKSAFADALGAVGMSLMSAKDRRTPLADFPQYYMKAQEEGQTREALRMVLKQAGFSDEEADRMARNPQIAKLAIDQKQNQKLEDWQKSAIGILGGAAPAPSGSPAPAKASGVSGPVGSFDTAVNRTFQFEGGYTPNDSNGAPANFGINQAANPDVSVKGLNQDQAKELYKTRYWDAIGGDQLAQKNPALAHVAFDAAVNSGPARAKQWLEQSGGDPQKFQQIRQDFLQNLLANNPDKFGPYAKSWASRMASLNADISTPSRGPQVASADPTFTPQMKPLGNNGQGISQIPDSRVVPASAAYAEAPKSPVVASDAPKPAFNPLSPVPVTGANGGAAPAPVVNPQNVVAQGQQILSTADQPKTRAQAQQEYNRLQAVIASSPSVMKDTPFMKQLEAQRDLLKKSIEPSQVEQDALAAGYRPGTPEYQQFIQGNADKTRTGYYNDWRKAIGDGSFKGGFMDYMREVKNLENSKAEDAQSVKAGQLVGEALTKPVTDLIDGVKPAKEKIVALNAMEEATKNPGLYTGFGGEQKQTFNKILQGVGQVFGIQPDESLASANSAGEALEKFGRQLAGAQAKSVGGSRVTNFELDQFIKSNPGLTMTPQGNQRLIGIMKQMAQREYDLGQVAQDYAAERGHKSNISEFRKKYMDAYDKANPIVDPISGKPLTSGTKLSDLDRGQGAPQPDAEKPAAPVSVPKISTRSQYDQLKPGDQYTDPQGNLRVKGGR